MSTLNLSQNILNAEANFEAGDWADAGASASLDFRASAELKRGLHLELGVGVLGQIDAAFHKFLAANAKVQVQASARLKGQIQAPIDLFGEAGVAVRLQAVAEAAAMVQLGIGLNIGDFIAQAEQDPRIRGIAARLLRIFLEELSIEAGVLGKIAYSAMAYVNLAITGRLIEDGSYQPGFTIAGEYGYGLEGGVGYRMFAHLGFKDTRRLIRRSVDVLVDEAVAELSGRIADENHRTMVSALRAPAKMALRTAFELGLALAESSPSFADTSQELSQRCVQVLLEEAQRFLLEQLTLLGSELLKGALAEMGVDTQTWSASAPARQAFAEKLRDLPDEPFEPTVENALYWAGLTSAAIDVALALGGEAVISAAWVEPVAVTWSAAQLMLVTVQRVTQADVRASFLGGLASVNAQAQAFSGDCFNSAEPPPIVRQFINDALGHPAGQVVRQDELVEFLTSAVLLDKLVQFYPQVEPVLQIVAGPTNDSLVAAAQTILKNANAFVQEDGEFDAVATLRVFATGLTAYIDVRIENELKPFLNATLDAGEDLKLYIDEALLSTLSFSVKVALNRVIDWGTGGLGYRDALREACSSMVMKLFGRSLVVATDVLMAHTLQHVHQQLELAADHVDDPDGIAQFLADQVDLPGMTAAEEQAFLGELLADTLHIGAQVFGPLPDATRGRIRQLLYDLLDTMPEPFDDDWLTQLKQDTGIPSQKTIDSLQGLGEELGTILVDQLTEFFTRVMLKLGEKALDFIEEQYLGPIQQQIELWVSALGDLLAQLAVRLLALPGELLALSQALLSAGADALDRVQDFLNIATADHAAEALAAGIGTVVQDAAEASPFWAPVAEIAEDGLPHAVALLLPEAFIDPIVAALHPTAQQAEAFLEEVEGVMRDLSEIDAQENITQQIAALFAEHAEEKIRAAFDDENPRVTIAFSQFPDPITGEMRPIQKLAYSQAKGFYWETVTITLVDVQIPLDDLVAAAGQALQGLSLFEAYLITLMEALAALLDAEEAHSLAEAELAVVGAQKPTVESKLAETYLDDLDIVVLAPTQASAHDGELDLEIFLENLPLSYLGLGEAEAQRFFCWLNLEPVDLRRFTVEEHRPRGNETRPEDTFSAVHGISVEVLQQEIDAIDSRLPLDRYPATRRLLDRATAEATAAGSTRTVVYQPGDTVAMWGSAPAPRRRVFTGHQPYSPAAARRAGRILHHGDIRRQTLHRGRPAVSTADPGRLTLDAIGAKPTIGEKNSALAHYGPGLLLRLRIPIEELAAGVNTLVLTISTGQKVKGQPVTVEKAVAFIVSAPERYATIDPGRIPTAFGHLPPALEGLLGDLQPDFAYRPKAEPTDGRGPVDRGFYYALPPRKERDRIRRQALEKITAEMRKRTELINLFRAVVRAGDLRPYGATPGPARRRPWRGSSPKTFIMRRRSRRSLQRQGQFGSVPTRSVSIIAEEKKP